MVFIDRHATSASSELDWAIANSTGRDHQDQVDEGSKEWRTPVALVSTQVATVLTRIILAGSKL
ncbi:MAG: hypothetical protein FWG15_05325 [Propionibacteriaceae bacterium]|nr:hypothetical protein [Propionibacteriaceae bacterium]